VSGFVATSSNANGWGIASRFAMRELRGGIRGFYIFIACIALGVAAIAGVGSVSRSMTQGIAEEGQTILGGDLDLSLMHRETSAAERKFLDSRGTVSNVATMRAMARLPEKNTQALVEVKAIDGAYPLYGDLKLTGEAALAAHLQRQGEAWGGVVETGLLARLNVAVGDTVALGKINIKIMDVIAGEPDRLAGGLGFGPRLMVSLAALKASGLVQPGSLVRWHYRLRVNANEVAGDGAIRQVMADAKSQFPDAGWRIRSRANATPGLSRNIMRFAQFLTLVGLTALIVGGVGVANAVRAFLDTKREVIATFKCLGASGGFVFKIYLIQILCLAGVGIAIGLVLGALMPLGAGLVLSQFLPIKTAAGLYPAELSLAALYGLLTALAFALWPLGRAHDVPPTALFRDSVVQERHWPRPAYIVATAAIVIGLAILAIVLAFDQWIATIYVVAAAAAYGLLRIVAIAIQAIARRAPRVKSTELRLAIGNIHRPGALTSSVVLSLGLGLTLLVTLALIDGNLSRQLTSSMPEQAPSFFFVDIQNSEVADFEKLLDKAAPEATISRVPMLRGRLVALKGVPGDQIKAPPNAQWALSGDRGITYASTLPDNSTLTAGTWWDADHSGENLVSFESDLAQAFGLKIGDMVTVNVLGRTIKAKIANLRAVDWQSLGINFVMVFSANTFAGAPHTHLATITWPQNVSEERELTLMKTVTAAFPSVTSVRVKDALTAINNLVRQLAWAIRGASAITLIASILVLAGALAAGHRNRIYDAVILKTLGATRRRVLTAYGMEYLLLGFATAVFGIVAGAGAGWFVVTQVMGATFVFLPSVAGGAAFIALIMTVGFGLIGTWRILGNKPAPVLRNL